MNIKKEINLDFIRNQGLIIFEAISGSHAYGTNIETSDEDIRGVFVLPMDYIMGNKYVEQVSDETNDIVFYEVRRFLELIAVNNPNILELLNTPVDCILNKHPAFDLVLENSDRFITKMCKDSFAGYARKQIEKAKGMNKMQNWEEQKITHKTPIDFCYVVGDGNERSIPLKEYLKDNHMDQKFCGLSKLGNSTGMYSLYYDLDSAKAFSKLYSEEDRLKQKSLLREKGKMGLGYTGIEKNENELVFPENYLEELVNGADVIKIPEGQISHALRCSSIPKGEKVVCLISYNGNGYSSHCKIYNKYQEWKKKANRTRWTDVKEHGQQIDGKNMLHCRRLLDMAKEIAEGKGINVRRPNVKELLDIRKGKIKLQDLIDHANEEIAQIDQLFTNSSLPDKIDYEMIHDLLVSVRMNFYNIHNLDKLLLTH